MKKNNRLLFLLIIILVIWNVILTVLLSNANIEVTNKTDINQTTVTGFSTDLTKIFADNKSSVVVVESGSSLSSGIIYKSIDDTVYVVTTYHGIADSNYIRVVFASGASHEASLVDKDIFSDIAVLEVKADFDVIPVKLGNSDLLNDGEFLACIGTPTNIQYANSNELAIVSNKLRTINNSITFDDNNYEYYIDAIQLSSDLKEGYSGSPIFNMAGEVHGLITMKDDTAVFALPINEVKIIADNIINGKEYNKIQFGFKGVIVNELETYEKNQLNVSLDINNGFLINSIKSNSFANSLGLKTSDVIISINDKTINKYADLLEIEYTDARTFELKVERNGEEIVLTGSIND